MDVNFVVDERTGRVIMMGALDNLVKGAAGQAVQHMKQKDRHDNKKALALKPSFHSRWKIKK